MCGFMHEAPVTSDCSVQLSSNIGIGSDMDSLYLLVSGHQSGHVLLV